MTERLPVILVAALTTAVCAPVPPGVSRPETATCVIVDDVARPHITVGVSTGDERSAGIAPDIHTGDGHSAAAVAGAQLHETLVRVDCTGSVEGGLAESWSSDDGRTWRFRIRPGVAFADGTPVNARSVAAALSVTASRLAGVTVAGEYDLEITLQTAVDVLYFAAGELAVVRRSRGAWPVGTGPYVVADSADLTRVLRLLARAAGGGAAGGSSTAAPDTIDLRTFGSDPRAALDAGADALVAGDAASLAYAQALGGYMVAPLPWNRTYLLASPPTMDAAALDAAAMFPPEVVRTAARSAQPPFWWRDCMPGMSVPARGAADERILYPRGDATARGIAERISALTRGRAPAWLTARMGGGHDGALAAVGVTGPELMTALRRHGALLVVVSVPRVHPAGCGASAADFFERFNGWDVLPLIDTRENLVYRPGIGRVIVDGDGTIRFGPR